MKRKISFVWLTITLALLLVSAGCAQDAVTVPSIGGGDQAASKPVEPPAEPIPVKLPEPTKDTTETETKTEARKMYDKAPAMQIDPAKSYTATIVTEAGNLELELFAQDVPNTVNNFVFLAREGFYDNTTFHRVITGFMAQAGDPTGSGMGGPGYKFADEFTSHGHAVGALSMANAGPGTNGSQFFITYTPQPGLDGRHSVFGQLTSGMDVLLNVENGTKVETITIQER
jgi:peptidyl-prolyl cis-trans isomerase B (cyclophilin B)